MALLDMKKMTLIAHADQKSAVLKDLQNLGAVEIVSTDLEELTAANAPQRLDELEKRLSDIHEALDFIRKYDEDKPSFFTPKPAISKTALNHMHEKLSETDDVIQKIKQFSDEINTLKTRKHRLKNKLLQLEPYEKFDAPLESICDNRYTTCLLGTIPTESEEAFQHIYKEYQESAYFEKIDEHKGLVSIYVVLHQQADEKLTGELKYIGFSEAYIKDLYGTPRDLIFDYESELKTLREEAREYDNKGKKFIGDQPLLKTVEDYLTNEIARERCIEKLGETGVTFMLEGWIVADDQDRIESSILQAAPESYIDFREPAKGEIPPSAFVNKKIVAPFEAVTNMYSVPSSKEIDPNFLMSIFYFIIFGMMIADFAYGIILTLGALLVLKLKKPTGMFRKITTVIMICGISTALWGLFFGTIFSIDGIPSIINPLEDAMSMLILCLGVGVLHLLFGLGIGAYTNIKNGKIKDAIFDHISWMMVLIGGILIAVGGTAATVGPYLAIAGVVILVFTQGRHKKGILGKAVGGLASIYNVTGYVSDILSYCRIFGMGLATTVIAMVFNTIASLFMGSAVGYIIGILVLTVGHVFNIAVNTLGAFVHTARLQYIEFFSKFYEGGGHAFMPLGIRTKNYRLEDER